MSPFIRVVVAVAATYAAGLIGYIFVDASTASWYAELVKPPFTPSDAVFALVWFILYAFMALALSIIWNKDPQTPSTEGWVRFYFVQLLFNAAWTMFFFGLHAVLVAFADSFFLGFVVLALIAGASDIDRRAMYLMLPYFLWLLFTVYLTLGIWWLN